MIIYGLMKFIEAIPERYDRMIGYLTFGGYHRAHQEMLDHIRPGDSILDIGCGTGSFLMKAAGRGAKCAGIDASMSMLRVCQNRFDQDPPEAPVRIFNRSAALLTKTFPEEKFRIITASLMLGELPEIVLREVLRQIPEVLADDGCFLICDELWPEQTWRSLLYSLIMAVTFIPNFILTRTMIRPVKNLADKLDAAGLFIVKRTDYALNVVSLLEIRRK